MSMKNKVAIISGGGRDIGKACAIDLAKQGADIAITYYSSSETALSAVKEIETLDCKTIPL